MATIPRGMCPLIASFSTGSAGGVDRVEVEGGPARYALAYDRGVQTFSVSLLLSPLQYSVWATFYAWTIKKGSISFDMPLDSGYGVQDHSCNIVPGSYSAVRSGQRTVVNFQVEAESAAYDMTAADAEDILDLYEEYGELTDALLARIAQFANVDTLVLDF
jgi:hypothetical protein